MTVKCGQSFSNELTLSNPAHLIGIFFGVPFDELNLCWIWVAEPPVGSPGYGHAPPCTTRRAAQIESVVK